MESVDHNWVACTCGSVPSLPVLVGFDTDNNIMYVGRAKHNGDYILAKVVPNKRKAFIYYEGNEIEIENYEALSGLHYEWVPSSNGAVPHGALKVGKDGDDYLYAGRGQWEDIPTLGKLHPSHGCLYIPCGEEEIKLTEYEVLTATDKWIDATATSMPKGALQCGHDANDAAIYVGRVFENGDALPAKVMPSKGGAYINWCGEEKKLENFQVLIDTGFLWIHCEHGNIVQAAVPLGQTWNGETLYIARANYNGNMCIGKIHPSHGCLLSFGGNEVEVEQYEVLIRT